MKVKVTQDWSESQQLASDNKSVCFGLTDMIPM
jgi:hypothetical protein